MRDWIPIKWIHTDGGKEYSSSAFETKLQNRGTTHEITVPCSRETFDKAKRLNETVLDVARAMQFNFLPSLRSVLKKEAEKTANYTRVRLITKSTAKALSSTKIIYSNVPSIKNVRNFGRHVYAHIPKQVQNGKCLERASGGIPVAFYFDSRYCI